MQALEATLTETYESPIADHIMAAWTRDHGPVQYFRASANFIFTALWQNTPVMLRFMHADNRRIEEITAEIAYLQHLATHDIHVALPILSLSGTYVEAIDTVLGLMYAVLFHRLEGQHYEIDTLSQEHFMRWGYALGTVHKATKTYQHVHRPTVDDQLAAVLHYLPTQEHAAIRFVKHIQHHISVLPRNDETFGLIHYDFELDNILWNNNTIGIIDFDDCTYSWFSADIAFALRDIFDERAEHIDMDDARFQAFIHGYRQVTTLSDAMLQQLPRLIQLHNAVSFMKVLQALEEPPREPQPAWVGTLQTKLARKAQSYRAYFAASTY